MRFHELLGHPAEAKTRAVANYYGVKLTGEFKVCSHGAGSPLSIHHQAATPQQNGKVERKFTMLYGRVKSMMNAEMLIGGLRTCLWAECAKTATNLDNIDCDNQEKKSRYKRFMGENYKGF